jgi:hypothetical protein
LLGHINTWHNKGLKPEEKRENARDLVRDNAFIIAKLVEKLKFMHPKAPTQCPLVLRVKVNSKKN